MSHPYTLKALLINYLQKNDQNNTLKDANESSERQGKLYDSATVL